MKTKRITQAELNRLSKAYRNIAYHYGRILYAVHAISQYASEVNAVVEKIEGISLAKPKIRGTQRSLPSP